MIIVLDSWRVLDKWWLSESEHRSREYVEVDWDGRLLIFVRTTGDIVWRIQRN